MLDQQETVEIEPKILVITTIACSYPGVDNAGQKHLEYPTGSYVIEVPDPVIFPIDFYIETLEMGYDGIFIASCGTDSPFKKTYEKLSTRIDKTVQIMKERGLHHSRLKLQATCTVCAEHFVKDLVEMYEFLKTNPQVN